MCPFTDDGTLTDWVDMDLSMDVGSTAGGTIGAVAGAYAGKKVAEEVLSRVPFGGLFGSLVGGVAGNVAGKTIGKKSGFELAGGWDYVKKTSCLSFNSLKDMADYLYVTYNQHEHFTKALDSTVKVYPEFKNYIH